MAVGLVGSAVAYAVYRLLEGLNERAALFAAGWLSVAVPAVLVAVVLGVQPIIARGGDGNPLFFPFDLSITLPAVVIPHAVLGIGEGLLTIFVVQLVRKLKGGEAK